MIEQLQIHRQILYDLTVQYLEPLCGDYERLVYLASLRDRSSGVYAHERLAAVFAGDRVGEVLAHCHEEIFERLLESPLSSQEKDLLNYLHSLPGDREQNLLSCRANAPGWIPPQAPDYLKELFFSNQAVLCELQLGHKPKVHSDT